MIWALLLAIAIIIAVVLAAQAILDEIGAVRREQARLCKFLAAVEAKRALDTEALFASQAIQRTIHRHDDDGS
ncbi:hypothetical protein IFU30_12480 [Plantibacter sp. CFBP 8798]|uniref:hypothetical protein n=1 Tax=Plantibacter sp. CFBP 8798 TaxID=2775268 RepID=UPI00177B9E57|nr:hypothetical protein [Plantibacter sp. CFBP 8798]MBD8467086.1 hypothetical protein [Plantibacter sp. CFBP 8798]